MKCVVPPFDSVIVRHHLLSLVRTYWTHFDSLKPYYTGDGIMTIERFRDTEEKLLSDGLCTRVIDVIR